MKDCSSSASIWNAVCLAKTIPGLGVILVPAVPDTQVDIAKTSQETAGKFCERMEPVVIFPRKEMFGGRVIPCG
ncbi:unnamed protein product [Enterobius vermicularis]|uniref:DUF512 domain-containing protein n=1 Tax=Enterobius vermicularis TaxID=51028 RepID=A0A0N4V268_ENTVE|nr:unnamed protein product [Enterobius vermicularis]